MLANGRKSRKQAVVVGVLATLSLGSMIVVGLMFASWAYDFGRHNFSYQNVLGDCLDAVAIGGLPLAMAGWIVSLRGARAYTMLCSFLSGIALFAGVICIAFVSLCGW